MISTASSQELYWLKKALQLGHGGDHVFLVRSYMHLCLPDTFIASLERRHSLIL